MVEKYLALQCSKMSNPTGREFQQVYLTFLGTVDLTNQISSNLQEDAKSKLIHNL